MGKTTLSDIVGPEYTKLGFFREVQEKMGELETYNAELERKKQEIQDILNGIMDLLAVVSPDYRIVYVNRVFARLLAFTDLQRFTKRLAGRLSGEGFQIGRAHV